MRNAFSLPCDITAKNFADFAEQAKEPSRPPHSISGRNNPYPTRIPAAKPASLKPKASVRAGCGVQALIVVLFSVSLYAFV